MRSILKEEGYPLALLPTYLAMIDNSRWSRQYSRLYVETPGGPTDVIGDGDLACALFVSSILHIFDLIEGGVHTTVSETVSDLETSGWYRIEEARPGCVIVWAAKACTDGLMHRHIGFCLSDGVAVSNSSRTKCPIAHRLDMRDVNNQEPRAIEAPYFHRALER